jgi:hypothetical protein
MRKSLTICCLLVLLACSRKFVVSPVFRKAVPSDMQQLEIDSSYRLYIREVFKDELTPGRYRVKKEEAVISNTDRLIEVEYLLLSTQKRSAIYISTIPDKFQNYYSLKEKYMPREYMNAYDFSTLRFGKIDPIANTIDFYNSATGHDDSWEYTMYKDSIIKIKQVVESIKGDATNVYLVDKALSHGASFTRLDSFKIAFQNFVKEKKESTLAGGLLSRRLSKDNIIYYRKENNKYAIYLRFDKNLTYRKDSAIRFNHKRLRNSPDDMLNHHQP